MQEFLNTFSTASNNFGLTISTNKIASTSLKAVTKLTYLGTPMSQSANIDDKINARIVKGSAAFGSLYASVWDRKGIKLNTK